MVCDPHVRTMTCGWAHVSAKRARSHTRSLACEARGDEGRLSATAHGLTNARRLCRRAGWVGEGCSWFKTIKSPRIPIVCQAPCLPRKSGQDPPAAGSSGRHRFPPKISIDNARFPNVSSGWGSSIEDRQMGTGMLGASMRAGRMSFESGRHSSRVVRWPAPRALTLFFFTVGFFSHWMFRLLKPRKMLNVCAVQMVNASTLK